MEAVVAQFQLLLWRFPIEGLTKSTNTCQYSWYQGGGLIPGHPYFNANIFCEI
jgi:hypothetical protein